MTQKMVKVESFTGENDKFADWHKTWKNWVGRFFDGKLGQAMDIINRNKNEKCTAADLDLLDWFATEDSELVERMASELQYLLIQFTKGPPNKQMR